jgi:hypothetical protein
MKNNDRKKLSLSHKKRGIKMKNRKLKMEEFGHSTITCPICDDWLQYYSKVARNQFIKLHYGSCLAGENMIGGNYLSFPITTAIFPRDI